MRRTHEPKWMYNKGGDLIGIAMGSDFCAEHEWGVDSMKKQFKTDDSKDGIERRIVRTIPEDLRLVTGTDYEAIFLSPVQSYYKQPENWIKTDELRRYKNEPLICGWDEKTFCVVAYGEKDRKNLAKLWEAFQKKDVAFWPNVGVFHMGGGLIFAIPSMVPADDKRTMLAGDLDIKKLKQAAADTGIEARLNAAKKSFFALSPKWISKDMKSAHPVMFWLNPMQQSDNNHGYFTVEDLEQWIEGKGPIPKSQEQLAKEQAAREAESRRGYRRY